MLISHIHGFNLKIYCDEKIKFIVESIQSYILKINLFHTYINFELFFGFNKFKIILYMRTLIFY